MKADPEFLRQHYGSLSDEALLDIDSADLVEMARKYYDAEVSRRGLTRRGLRKPAAPPPPVEPEEEAALGPMAGEEQPDWLDSAAEVYSVTVSPGSEDTLAGVRNLLDAAGIPCHIESVETSEEEERAYQIPDSRWRIMVPEKLSLRAMSTLERDISNPEFEGVWKTHLETLSNKELLQTSPETVFCGLFDRVARVTRAFEEELERRGLTVESR